MFGLMEITGQFDEAIKLAIIPTFILPFTIVGMVLTGLATWIAALFGIKLKAEGPKRLFELLMKPKVILLMLISNLAFYGLYLAWGHVSNGPYPLWWIKMQNASIVSSDRNYSDRTVQDKGFISTPSGVIKGFEVVWQYSEKSLVFGEPVLSGGSVFLSDVKGRVLELDLASGKLLRKFEIGQPVTASPLIASKKLFVGEGIHLTHDARFYSFDLESGKFKGAFSTAGHIERAGTLAKGHSGDSIVFPAGKDGVYAIDPKTMTKKWQASIGHVDSVPISDDKRVYVGTGVEKGFADTATQAFALDSSSGEILWSANLPSSSWGIPVLWKEHVCFSVGDVYENTELGYISCLNSQSGEKIFDISVPGALIGQPVVVADQLIVSDLQNVVYQINLQEQKIEWSIKVPALDINYSSVLLDNQDRLIAPGKEGLYIYSRSNQQLLNIWKPESGWSGSFTNAVISDDLWIVADASGKIHGIRPIW